MDARSLIRINPEWLHTSDAAGIWEKASIKPKWGYMPRIMSIPSATYKESQQSQLLQDNSAAALASSSKQNNIRKDIPEPPASLHNCHQQFLLHQLTKNNNKP